MRKAIELSITPPAVWQQQHHAVLTPFHSEFPGAEDTVEEKESEQLSCRKSLSGRDGSCSRDTPAPRLCTLASKKEI